LDPVTNVSIQSDVCLYFLAIFLPPLAVFLKSACSADFFINILLSILGWIPGVIRTSSTTLFSKERNKGRAKIKANSHLLHRRLVVH